MDLKALILNCALKRLPEPSNTQALIDIVPGWQPEECGGHDDRMPGGHVG